MANEITNTNRDTLWKQYELHVSLYKEYLKLLLEFNVFYYAATGALLSYFFSKPEIPCGVVPIFETNS